MEHYNLAFEKSILGAMIFDPMLFERYGMQIKETDLYLHFHQNLLAAMKQLAANDKPIDEEFIAHIMRGNGTFNEQLMIDVLVANPLSDPSSYIEEIKALAQRRRLMTLALKIQQSSELPVADALNMVESELSNIVDNHLGSDKLDIVPMWKLQELETEFILKRWMPMPKGTLTMLFSKGGVGKSWTAIQMGIQLCNENPNARVALWLSEDPENETKSRGEKIVDAVFNKSLKDYPNIHIVRSRPPKVIKNKKFDHNAFYRITNGLKDYDLVVLDPIRSFYGGEENDNTQANLFIDPFQDWAAVSGNNVVFIHHATEDMNGRAKHRGASAFHDGCRTMYSIDYVYLNQQTKDIDKDRMHERSFKLTKDNLGGARFLDGDHTFVRQITPRINHIRPVVVEEFKMKVEMPTL